MLWRSLLLAAATAVASASAVDFSLPCKDVARTEKYAAQIDAAAKTFNVRSFAQTFDQDKEVWREVKAIQEVEGTGAAVYLNDANIPVAAFFTFQTESGDWILDVAYYYRLDGSLAKQHGHLNTFYGHLTVLRDAFFDCKGVKYHSSVDYLDLKTQKPVKPGPDFIDEQAPDYPAIQRLPFYPLIRKTK